MLKSIKLSHLGGLRSGRRITKYKIEATLTLFQKKFFSLEKEQQRESIPFDVVIIGGGPAGLSASIRLKQLCEKNDVNLSVCVLEKGNEIGSHILSGNVFETRSLKELLSFENSDSKNVIEDWIEIMKSDYNSIPTPVSKDEFVILSETSSYAIPNFLLPPQLHNEGNYIISLSQLCRFLGNKAEDFGVEVFPGFAAADVVFENNAVLGVTTRDAGIDKTGQPKENYEPGMNVLGRQTLFAEGARGSCTKIVLDRLGIKENKTFGLGLKEVWTIPEDKFQSGLVQHSIGWPLQASLFDQNFGGSFLYHQEPNLVLAGFVVGLDYQNPYLNPYKEFQKWKTHPEIRRHFEGGNCVSYGARVLNEGGYHSIPRLTFDGGMILGCSAGFLNSNKIKGTHTAIQSGIEAAEAIFQVFQTNTDETVANLDEIPADYQPIEIKDYDRRMKSNWVHDELYSVRNCHAAFAKWGLVPGLIYSGVIPRIFHGHEPWTLTHSISDSECTKPEQNYPTPISYPAPDNMLTFDLLTNLQRSNTYHEEDQPSHLQIKPDLTHVPKSISMQVYAAPETRFCPAGVYEYPDDKNLHINAQNCIHCKCCSIKMPHEYITWCVPEGGGGPQYQIM